MSLRTTHVFSLIFAAVTTAQLKNAFTGIGDVDASLLPASLTLKVAVSNAAIRYFVLSQTHGQVIFFGNYSLHHVNKADELAYRMEKVAERDEILQLPFGKTYVGIDTPYTLAPAELAFMLKNYSQLSQNFDSQQTELIYDYSYEVKNMAERLFRNPQLMHLNSTFLRLLPASLDGADRLFVNVSPNHSDVFRYSEDRKLQFMNRFEFQTAADFIYYLLLFSEDFKIDREKTELVLAGEVDIQSKIYDLCYRYFRNIAFIQKPENVHFSKAFDMFPKHLHFNLYNLGE